MKLAAFDMDGTLIEGRTIFYLASAFDFTDAAHRLIDSDLPLKQISMSLAGHMKGVKLKDAMDVVSKSPLMAGAVEVIEGLKELGYKLAIITDSYDFAARSLLERLGMDELVANELVVEDGVFTGGLIMPEGCPKAGECNRPSICKKTAFLNLIKKYGVDPRDTIAVGDNRPDICMVEEAGVGFAIDPKVPELEEAADVVIRKKDLREILDHLPK